MHRNKMKWTNVDFVFQRIQIWFSNILYLISFVISVYLYFEINCSNTFFLASMLTSIIAYVVPLYVYGCLKPKEDDPMYEDTLSVYKVGKMVHVVAAVVATLYNAMALAETIHLKEICPSYKKDTDWILTYSIINTIAYNGVTFLGHSMMRKPKAKQDAPEVAYKVVEPESGKFRSDLQRRNSVRF